MLDTEAVEHANRFLKVALDIGTRIHIRGAEIHRVEDTIKRICLAYGAEEVDVFSITYTIVVTMSAASFGVVTQTRRISEFAYNLHMMEELNALSRRICDEKPPLEVVEAELKRIRCLPQYGNMGIMASYAIISSAFTLFFGGVWADAVVSGVIGIIMRCVEIPLRKLEMNRFFVVCLCAAAAGFCARLCVAVGLGVSADKISIGNIMVFIPGLLFTNSVRDMFANNIISGFVRFCEAIFLSVAVAFGFVLAKFCF